jgi:hypothetical protein
MACGRGRQTELAAMLVEVADGDVGALPGAEDRDSAMPESPPVINVTLPASFPERL